MIVLLQTAGCLGGILFLLFVMWRLFMYAVYAIFGETQEEEVPRRHRAKCLDCNKPILCAQDDGCVADPHLYDEDEEE